MTPAFWLCSAMLLVGIAFFAISKERRCAEEKKDIDDQIIHSQKMSVLGELSSGIAHEINTPLGIIGQETELLQMLANRSFNAGPDTTELLDRLEQIALQVERCGEITHQLLDFARKTGAIFQATNLSQVSEDMIRLVEREASYNNIIIQREFTEKECMVRTDPSLVRQVVLNLLQNAVQAVEEDGNVTVSTRNNGKWAEITVSDTGCGISSENLRRVFDPFFTTKPPGKGTGLGLSICMKIAQRLGGAIHVRSEQGRGTDFTLLLPATEMPGEAQESKTKTRL
ncbi:sensor histidine kinase [Desulfovibrio inopinatus]|uniref:sensor histidine kinase n=1 Tax=Desulfovibrio inopinatus TaxID=102109 RepID=UPI0003F688EB|nr:ATP-binding protein [Desulfovibrio inopinatus]